MAEEINECNVCSKIICRGCGWQPNNEESHKIVQGILTACPLCGWSPN